MAAVLAVAPKAASISATKLAGPGHIGFERPSAWRSWTSIDFRLLPVVESGAVLGAVGPRTAQGMGAEKTWSIRRRIAQASSRAGGRPSRRQLRAGVDPQARATTSRVRFALRAFIPRRPFGYAMKSTSCASAAFAELTKEYKRGLREPTTDYKVRVDDFNLPAPTKAAGVGCPISELIT